MCNMWMQLLYRPASRLRIFTTRAFFFFLRSVTMRVHRTINGSETTLLQQAAFRGGLPVSDVREYLINI